MISQSRPTLELSLVGLLLLAATATAQAIHDGLPRRSPESQGVASQAILDFIQDADQQVDSMHSFMLLRHGNVVAEAWWSPESAEKPHILWSLTKSFTSTAVGLAIHEKKISLDDRVVDYFPNETPSDASQNLRNMRIRDLLRMASGHQTEPPRPNDSSWTRAFLSHPVPFKPGTHFQYNTPASHMLSAIVQKATGQKLRDYLNPRLFQPLGIIQPEWRATPQGISIGGYGLYLRTEDIAKFGQLYLQRGEWNDRQLVPSEWVSAATGFRMSNGSNPDSDWEQGYGYQFWQCRHDAYRGDGKDGQFCVVLPQQDAVVVMTAKSKNLAGQLNLVWKHLLPAFTAEPKPEAPGAEQRLKQVLSQLKATR